MRELLDYRSEFPILEHTTYLINHSLAAMPAKAEERLAEYARMWKERGIRSWGEGWWTMPMTVGDQIGRIIGGAPDTTVMHQNVAVAEAVVLSSFFPIDPARNRVVYEQGNFPSVRYLYQAQPDLEVVVCEDDGGDRRRDRRADAARADQPRALQDRRDPGDRADHPAGARGRRLRDPRLLPERRHRPVRRHCARMSTSPSAARSSGCAAAPATAGSTSAPTWRSGSGRRTRAGRRTSGRSASRRRWSTRRARRAS